MRRLWRLMAAGLTLLLVLGACQSSEEDPAGDDAPSEERASITVGVSGAFAENQIVAEMYAQVLEEAGYPVERQLSLQTREISQTALESAQIDLKPEYQGSLLQYLEPDSSPSSDPEENVGPLEQALEPLGLTALAYSEANDTNAFVVTGETAEQYDLTTVGDLAPVAGDLTFGGPPECEVRPFCIPGLRDTYDVEFGTVEKIGACDAATATALREGQIDVALLCSTQSVIAANNWVVLEDDRNLQRAENLTPIIRTDKLTDEVRELLNAVSDSLTTSGITRLNAQVELNNEDPEDVAREHLESEGLL